MNTDNHDSKKATALERATRQMRADRAARKKAKQDKMSTIKARKRGSTQRKRKATGSPPTTVSAVRSEACASAHRQRLQQRRNGNSFLLMAKWDPGESAPFRAPSESPLERELKGIGSELR